MTFSASSLRSPLTWLEVTSKLPHGNGLTMIDLKQCDVPYGDLVDYSVARINVTSLLKIFSKLLFFRAMSVEQRVLW